MDITASRILELRESNDLNKTDFAKKLEINRSTVTRYEIGELKPTLDVMIRMNMVFAVSLDWIAGIDNSNQKYNPIIKECVETGITPERLKRAVELLKG